MPTYEYACQACGNEWEAEQSIKDAALTECPSCKAQSAKRQISKGAGFILKGGGWYSDLYSSSSKKSEAKSESSESKSEVKGESKSESKSEPKSETKSESSTTTKESSSTSTASTTSSS
jgi:putative FmdB family regulatory protein